jgi:hypothetical protein
MASKVFWLKFRNGVRKPHSLHFSTPSMLVNRSLVLFSSASQAALSEPASCSPWLQLWLPISCPSALIRFHEARTWAAVCPPAGLKNSVVNPPTMKYVARAAVPSAFLRPRSWSRVQLIPSA